MRPAFAVITAAQSLVTAASLADEAPSRPPVVLTDRARDLHRSAVVVDGHNDLPWEVRTKAGSSWNEADIARPQPRFHTDIPRLRSGNVGVQFWSVYVPAETRFKGQSAQQVFEQIDL